MMPHLSIVKTRFAKASLRPRCARHRSWGATCRLPNRSVGRQASQWFRGSSSFPMNVTGRQAEVHSGSASITRQSARCFVSLIAGPTHHAQTGGDLHPLSQPYRSCQCSSSSRQSVRLRGSVQDGDLHYLRAPSNGLAIFVAISPQQVMPLYESSRRGYSPIQVITRAGWVSPRTDRTIVQKAMSYR